jgi:serine/threonine-protein kinase RsbW
MSKRRTFKFTTGVSHLADPVLQVQQSIRSEVPKITPLVEKLMFFIRKCRCVPGNEIDVEISLREALANAVVHGNHEDPRKHVYIACVCMPGKEVSMLIRDEGKGFRSNEFSDPTSPAQLEATHGRGLYLMRALMDDVHFERGGAVVHMRKKSAKGPNPPRSRL